MEMNLPDEIAVRLGMIRPAYQDLSSTIFSNRALPTSTRLLLLQSLVMSKFLHGAIYLVRRHAFPIEEVGKNIDDVPMSHREPRLLELPPHGHALCALHRLLPFRALWRRFCVWVSLPA